MASKSRARLTAVIKEKAAQIILFELKDPRLGFLTVTRVKLAPDLSTCRVFYSVIGTDGIKSRTRHALNDARGFIQRRIGQTLRTRLVPHLEFEYDESIEGAFRVSSILKELAAERALTETDPDAESDSDSDTDSDTDSDSDTETETESDTDCRGDD